MKRILVGLFLLLAFAHVCKAQTTTVVTATIRDVTGTIIPSGQVTFELKPGVDTTISGNARFTPTTVACTINQAYNGGAGTISSLVRSSNVVTATFIQQTSFVVGDVFSLGGWSDTTFDGTSAFTVTAVSGVSPWTVTWNQTATNSSATGGFISALRATNPGPGSCTLTQNTALTPAGTFYLVTLWPNNSPSSSFNFYALQASVDLSTVTPTPTQMPAYSFFDLFSNQTVSGTKTFSGPVIFTGSVTGPFVTSVGLTVPAEFTLSGCPVTSSGTCVIGKASVAQNSFLAGPASGGAGSWGARFIAPLDLGTGTANNGSSLFGDLTWKPAPSLTGAFTVGDTVTVASINPPVFQDGGSPSSAVPVQVFGHTTLASDISLATSTPTTVLTTTVTMPTSGCPCRIQAAYGVYASTNNQTWNTWVGDGTNFWAAAQTTGAGTNTTGLNSTAFSNVTYANSAVVTLTLTVEINGSGGTVKAAPAQGSGGNTWLSWAVMASN